MVCVVAHLGDLVSQPGDLELYVGAVALHTGASVGDQ
jgi:hypothetical protein